MKSIFVIEDEANLRELIADLLQGEVFGAPSEGAAEVKCFETIATAEAAFADQVPDLVLCDIKLPDGDGLQLLDRLRTNGMRSPTIVMTAFGTVERAVQALKAGASDFLVKPFDNERLRASVARALAEGRQLEDLEMSAGKVAESSELGRELIGAKGGLQDVVELLPRVAATEATVLVRGESGTGKELVARAIHNASPRMDGPFVSLNCAAIAPGLIESELFGFERGAFTGAHARRKGHVESAAGGTLFLDEIGDMPLEAQSKLLRVLQEREITRVGGREPVQVDVRVVAATHRDLDERVAQGHFREDLLYRLNVIPIELPPLRARKQDIPGLVEHFLVRCGHRHGVEPPRPDAEVWEALRKWDWPGNVRELQNFVERSVVLGSFDVRSLARRTKPAESAAPEETVPDEPVRTLKEVVHEAERRAVLVALRAAEGNKAQAARLLGVSYKTLFNKINEHKIRTQTQISAE